MRDPGQGAYRTSAAPVADVAALRPPADMEAAVSDVRFGWRVRRVGLLCLTLLTAILAVLAARPHRVPVPGQCGARAVSEPVPAIVLLSLAILGLVVWALWCWRDRLLRADAAVPVAARMELTTMRGWHLIGDDARRYVLEPAWERGQYQEAGPVRAWVVPSLGIALRWFTDGPAGRAVAQHTLDSYFGLGGAHEEVLVPIERLARIRARLERRALGFALLPVVVFAGLSTCGALDGPIVTILLGLTVLSVLHQRRSVACEPTEITGQAGVWHGQLHVFQLLSDELTRRYVPDRLACHLPCGAIVRVLAHPLTEELLAIEILDDLPSRHPVPAPATLEHELDRFREQFR